MPEVLSDLASPDHVHQASGSWLLSRTSAHQPGGYLLPMTVLQAPISTSAPASQQPDFSDLRTSTPRASCLLASGADQTMSYWANYFHPTISSFTALLFAIDLSSIRSFQGACSSITTHQETWLSNPSSSPLEYLACWTLTVNTDYLATSFPSLSSTHTPQTQCACACMSQLLSPMLLNQCIFSLTIIKMVCSWDLTFWKCKELPKEA